jgi:hypothetical protein
LAHVGFTNVKFYDDLPNKVQSADQDSLPGYVLSNGIDANGRVIGFVCAGAPPASDGASVFLDNTGVDQSVNTLLLQAGLAYPASYGTLPASLRAHLADASRAARANQAGIWARSTADPNQKANIANLDALQGLVMSPKLFRRLVPYLAAGNTTVDAFDTGCGPTRWTATTRSSFFKIPPNPATCTTSLPPPGSKVQLTTWPEDFVIAPDPAPPGTTTGIRRYTAGDVVVVAALPDPAGPDLHNETVSLANLTAGDIDLQGWRIADQAGRRQDLTDIVVGGDILRIMLTGGLALGNRGGSLTLDRPHRRHHRSRQLYRDPSQTPAP